jgi:hypothetical protein|tara:strand:- start:134 stop:466 length:333 start_codon:yes stop_codon:yes gene_type:complete
MFNFTISSASFSILLEGGVVFSPFDKSTTTVSSSTAAGFAPSSPPSEEKDFVADVEIHFLVLLPRLANEEVEEEDFVNEDDDARSRWRPFFSTTEKADRNSLREEEEEEE